MNAFQLLNEIKERLQNQVWTGSSTPVFNDDAVRIISGEELEAYGESLQPPAALIRPGANQSDPLHGEEPDLIQFTFDVLIIMRNSGDRVGENPVMGANRQSLTTSDGRGVMEIEEELYNAISRLGDDTGVRVQSIAAGAAQIAEDANDNVVAARQYTFEAMVTANRYYHAPRGVSATDLTGGDVRVRWTDPPSRFGRLTIRIRRAAGSTPPASASDGTQVADVSLGVGSYVDSPGAGEFSYAVFGGYEDYGGATADRFSDAETGTTATETIT